MESQCLCVGTDSSWVCSAHRSSLALWFCDSVTQRTCPCHFLGEERYGDHANLQMTAQLNLASV